ncbi:MAG: hypothetical protein NZ993_04730 [Bacteroidetes bacterium]|nr:hypothetical protein [Bacteroidota bacterium]
MRWACVAGAIWASATIAWAQAGWTGSVYSRFGIGDLWVPASGASAAMGHSGLASVSERDWNLGLPAAWAALSFTRASARLYVQGWEYRSAQNRARLFSGNLAEVALGFPIGDRIGLGLGFWPYSQVGYRIRQSGQVEAQAYTVSAEGDGGLHQLALGMGAGLLPGWSLGLGLYRWMGAISHQWNVQFSQDSAAAFLDSRYQRYTRYTGWSGSLSMLYVRRERDRGGPVWSLAAEWAPPARLQARRTWTLQYGQIATNALQTDTLSLQGAERVTIPARWSLGAAVHVAERWGLQTAFAYQPWSRLEHTLSAEWDRAQDLWRVGVGGFWVPDPENLSTYLKRIIYRVGFFYEQTPLVVHDRPISRWGVSFGLGLPTRDPRTTVDLNVELSRRGALAAGLVQEWQYRFSLVFNYAERWFIRRRIE